MSDEKQAPPTYSEAATAPTQTGYNAGYAPPQGDQGGYPPQAGYPQGYGGHVGQNNQYPPQQGYGTPGQGGYGAPPQAGYGAPGQYGYNQTVVVTQPTRPGMVVNSVPDNMGLAIFTTICCCWPLGIVAILRAQESRRALDRGDVTAASNYSAESRRYSMFAIAGGVVSIIVAIVIIVVVVTTNINAYNNYYD